MDRQLLVTLLGYTGLIGGLYLLFIILAPFLPAIGWAAVIAIATYPLYRRLQARLGKRPNLSAALMTIVVFLVILVPTSVIMTMLVKEVVRAERALVAMLERGGYGNLDEILQHPMLLPWIERLTDWVSLTGMDFRAALADGAKIVLAWLAANFGAVIKNLFLFIFQLFLIVVALFFVYRDGQRAERAFWAALPMSAATKTRVRDTTGNVVAVVVSGVLVTAAVQASVATLAYWICGLSSVILLGALTFLAAFIPVVGTALVWLPAGLYLLLTGETTYAIVLLVWGAAVVSTIDSVLRPILISGGTGLPLSLMMLGALGGLLAFGFFGLVVGPLALAVFLVGFDSWQRINRPVPRKRAG